jgi:Tol biopolymer transport system component
MGVIRLLTVVVVMLGLLAVPNDGHAQYFGRNKVEYVDFDFRILSTEHFDIYYYPREERATRLAAQLAERWYARFVRILGHEFDRRQPLVLYGSQSEFAQTNVVSGLLPDTVGGVTEGAKRRIAMPFAPTLAETNRVLGHEIAHAFQFDIARRHGGGWGQPLWFIEGMAEYLARGGIDAEASVWLRDAVTSGRLPQRQRDAARRLSPYQYGHAFWAYLAQRFGDEVVEKALKPGKHRKFEARMRHATGLELDELFSDWRRSVTAAYSTERRAPDRTASPSRVNQTFGRMQLGPALSPDGRQAVFFSERDRLSLDLFLADVETGQILRKLATTVASARFDSLQPVRSAGAWSRNAEWFAFPAVRKGHAALVLIDMHDRGRDREIPFPQLGQILSATWAPDGRAIAFSALSGGFSDLYLYDLASAQLRKLTDDPFADLHPAWSPAGDAIAFSTERFSSDLSVLRFGQTRLASIDVSSGAVHEIAATTDAARGNPQWSANGRDIYFVSNPDGIGNVFRVDPNDGSTHQVTDADTGIGGITPTSPAISVASQAAVLAYTVYRNGTHQLEILNGPTAIEGEPYAERSTSNVDGEAQTSAHSGSVADLLADHRTGVPDPAVMVTREYSPRLSLERIGQPYISSGGGAFGTFVRGGGSMLFGDMLGERRLGAAIQIGNRLRDAAFEARFLNQAHRWNWGAIAELEPSLRRYRRSATIDHAGQPALLKQADYLQRVQLRAAGLLAYPFSRGLRVEFTGGVRHAAYHRDVRSQIMSVATGRVLEDERVESSGGAPTTVAEIASALVGDTTVFGPTGPLLGSRYRVEIGPAIGSLSYTRVLVDYRHYVMPVRPYSFAVRVLHSGRYGRDGDDPRLISSFLGSRYFVRGHGRHLGQCRPDAVRICDDDLIGNRLLVANLELRVPIWSMFSRQIAYGPLPADAFLFADAGMVWSSAPSDAMPAAVDSVQAFAASTSAALSSSGRRFTRRSTISSIGGGVRLSAGGLPVEVVAVRALDGPAPGWSFDLGFRFGF